MVRRDRDRVCERGDTAEGLAWAIPWRPWTRGASDKRCGAVRKFDLESGANYTLRARESASDAPGRAGDEVRETRRRGG